jgi:hypothetical protein
VTDDLYRDCVAAARTTQTLNTMLGNGIRAPWTQDDFLDFASSLAAERGMPGRCPVCGKEVRSNDCSRIAKHRDGAGSLCTASGTWYHIAVAELNA